MNLRFGIAALLLVIACSCIGAQEASDCPADTVQLYKTEHADYTATLQSLINEASSKGKPTVTLAPGRFRLRPDTPVVLKPGVSLHGNAKEGAPSILVGGEGNHTATIQVPADNRGWSIKGIVFDNVNIVVDPHFNDDETSVLGNLFLNGGRGSVIANYGANLYIDGNVFLRDLAHAGTEMIPSYNTTNTGILFQTQKSSVISNNIFGMDMRKLDEVAPHVSPQVQRVLENVRFLRNCLDLHLDDQQGFMASGVQLYSTYDITIRENIMNGTLPDTIRFPQDHAISIVGSNSTYIYQNFFAGWELADFGGATRFTSAVDGYVISNYLANDAVMMYAATHADFMQVSNMVIYNNFFYKFIPFPVPEPLKGWLYEGITFYDFWTARLNYTIMPPIWNSTVPISPWGWHIVISNNRFGAVKGMDPNVISLGNMDPREAFVDHFNCYVTEPLIPQSENGPLVPILWRQTFEPGLYTQHGGKVPKKYDFYTDQDLTDNVPAHLRNLPIPQFWKAFKLANDTVPMMDPNVPCIS